MNTVPPILSRICSTHGYGVAVSYRCPDISREVLAALPASAPPRRAPSSCWRRWDENADPFTRTVSVTVTRLRRKLGAPEVIVTIAGAGYGIRLSPASPRQD